MLRYILATFSILDWIVKGRVNLHKPPYRTPCWKTAQCATQLSICWGERVATSHLDASLRYSYHNTFRCAWPVCKNNNCWHKVINYSHSSVSSVFSQYSALARWQWLCICSLSFHTSHRSPLTILQWQVWIWVTYLGIIYARSLFLCLWYWIRPDSH